MINSAVTGLGAVKSLLSTLSGQTPEGNMFLGIKLIMMFTSELTLSSVFSIMSLGL